MMVVPGLYGNNTATPAEAALHDTRLVAKLGEGGNGHTNSFVLPSLVPPLRS
jgi:hypothetical protein